MHDWTNEQLLIEYLTTKNNAAFNHLYERLHRPMCSLATRILDSWQDVDDVVQEAFEKLARAKPNRITCVHSLAFKIVQNAAYIRVRRNKRRQSLQFDHLPRYETYRNFVEADPSQLEDSELSDKLPFRGDMKSKEWLLNRDRWQIIQDILPMLTEQERILLEGRFMHNLTYSQLAKQLHIHRISIARLVEKMMDKVQRLIESNDAT